VTTLLTVLPLAIVMSEGPQIVTARDGLLPPRQRGFRLGKRAETVLPRIRQWMNTNSWIVSEAVILFFLVMTLTS
jgi:hypothetical protein